MTDRMVCDKWFIIEVKLYTVVRIGEKCYSLWVWLWTWSHVYGAKAQQTNLDRRHKGEQDRIKPTETYRFMSVSHQLQTQQHSSSAKSGTFATELQLSPAHGSAKLQEGIQLGAEFRLPSYFPFYSHCSFLLWTALRGWRGPVCSVAHSCPSLCHPMYGSPPGSSVHGTFQARILEWVAIFYSRGSALPRDRTHVSCISCIGGWILYQWATWEA